MSGMVEDALAVLEQAGVRLGPGLTGGEVASVYDRFGFEFSPDQLALLTRALPLGELWPDWRSGDEADLRRSLGWPVESFVWDVLNQKPPFWPASWGPLPTTVERRERNARRRLAEWPVMVPVFGHRYMAAAPAKAGGPVFSIWQTDVIYYGPNLAEYLRNEFGVDPQPRQEWRIQARVPFWTALVESGGSAEMI